MLDGWKDLKPFKAWCIQILPSIFDDSMSYYEVLCKVIKILNNSMEDINILMEEIETTNIELDEFKELVKNQFEELKNGEWIQGTISYLEKLLEKYIPVAIFFGLTESGNFVAYIPDSWDNIQFNTTGYDYPSLPDASYGHLILSY